MQKAPALGLLQPGRRGFRARRRPERYRSPRSRAASGSRTFQAAAAPAKTAKAARDRGPSQPHLERLDGLSVVGSTRRASFSSSFPSPWITPADNKPSGVQPYQAGPIYIDVNHRPRAGMSRPLGGRPCGSSRKTPGNTPLKSRPPATLTVKTQAKGPAAAGALSGKGRSREHSRARAGWRPAQGNPPRSGANAALMLAPKERRRRFRHHGLYRRRNSQRLYLRPYVPAKSEKGETNGRQG